MKTLKNFLVVTVAFALVADCWPHNANAQTPPAIVITNAPAPPVTPVVPPPNIVPGSPYAEVVRLTQAGVDQSIIMAYVTNCTSLFNLDSAKIIYLSDLGAPSTLVTAMMQHDQQLQQQFAANQAAQQAQQAPPAEAAPAPETTSTNIADVTPPPEPPVTVNYFYDTLSPYGSWVVINGYGRCWRPTVCVYNSNWQPYCDNGHWVYSDCGWYWSSSYAWGATFHYGRWFQAPGQGWCWYPDTVWAPSWVTWRYSANYCGWAPLPPRTYCQPGVGIVYQGGGVGAEFSFGLGAGCFTFVPTQYFCNSHPRNYCAAPAQVTQIYNQTKVINNIKIKGDGNNVIINNGIAVQNVAAATQSQIRPVPVREIDRSFSHDGHKQLSGSTGQFGGVNRQNLAGNDNSAMRPSMPSRTTTATATEGQNPARSTSAWGNGNNRPVQTQFSPPVVTQTPQPGQTATAPQTGQQFSRARTQTDRNNTAIATVTPNPVPTANDHSPMRPAPVQTPAIDSNPQRAPAQWQQPDTQRNANHNSGGRQNVVAQSPVAAPAATYSAPQPAPQPHQQNFNQPRNDVRQSYSAPVVASAPQQSAQASASSQSGGGRNGNQIWGAR